MPPEVHFVVCHPSPAALVKAFHRSIFAPSRTQRSVMTFARATRLLLALAATLIVAWSFFDVGRRAVGRWRAGHDRPVVLTVMHWGERAEDAVVQQLVERYKRENPHVEIVRI